MSLTSAYGDFELISFSCDNKLLLGRNALPSTANVVFTIKNNTGKTINNCKVFVRRHYRRDNEGSNMISGVNAVSSGSNLSWVSGDVHTFSGSITFKSMLYQETLVCGEKITPRGTLQVSPNTNIGLQIAIEHDAGFTIVQGAMSNSIANINLNQDETDRFMPVWLRPFRPSLQINAARCNAEGICEDEGDYILIAAKLDVNGELSYSDMVAAGYNGNSSKPTVELNGVEIDHSITLGACHTGIFEFLIDPTTDASIGGTPPKYITQIVPASSDYKLRIAFEDFYEPCEDDVDIARAFANLHLSEYDDGGACFGGFCKRTAKGKPQFESHYASVFHKPIKEENGTPLQLALGSKFSSYSFSNLVPTLRAFGSVVTLQGEITPSASIAGGTAQHVICTIPEKFAPPYIVTTIQQGTGQAVWLMRIYPKRYGEQNDDGTITERGCTVTFARYREGNAYAAAPAGAWLPFYATWISPHTFEDE